MTSDKTQRLAKLSNQLTEMVMSVAICAQEIRAALHAELDGQDGDWRGRTGHLPSASLSQRPFLDASTLCVRWSARSLHLGNTVSFRLLDRLARRPNQYVTHLDLIHDVWEDDDTALATVRSVVRHLRRKLRDGGMPDLAEAIQGHNGRYILVL